MLQKTQIKYLHFNEHPNTCTMILISRKNYKLITQSVFVIFIHQSMFYFDANPILVLFAGLCNRLEHIICKINVCICMKGKSLSTRCLS